MDKKIPMRRCIGCGEGKEKRELIRIVRSQENGIFTDSTGKANGRGAYICKNKECLLKAIKSKGLDRAFKEKIPSDVYEGLKKEFDEFE